MAYVFLLYFTLINIITFLLWGIDKRKAQHNKWRIKEHTLLQLGLFGGWIGALFAIELFRHKTVKSRFAWKIYIIGFLWICGFILFISYN